MATQVLDIVRERGCFLIEDDWAHDFGIDSSSEPLAAREDSGRVIYLRSLTKSISPSMRVAAVVARGPVRDRILADIGAESMYVSGILQAAALDVVSQPGWSTHRRGLRYQLRSRRDALVESLREHARTSGPYVRPVRPAQLRQPGPRPVRRGRARPRAGSRSGARLAARSVTCAR